jgi:UDP-N-acetylglucosamine diphosphorylase/glucosamine-1-phosphate N-acetyltransferase
LEFDICYLIFGIYYLTLMGTFNHIILFDGAVRDDLLPLTFTRPVAELRIGITTIREKWELTSGLTCSWETQDYLAEKYPIQKTDNSILINAAIIPDAELWDAITNLSPGETMVAGEEIIAKSPDKENKKVEYKNEYLAIRNTWDIFSLNDTVLRSDFEQITRGRNSLPISSSNQVMGAENVFLEEGAKVECAILNASTGPVFIGRDSEIMEGSVVRGPFALCEHAALKLGTKIYGATTIGPYCKVGGEVNNSVFTGYSSKAHDGFLGNAVIGEWCNLGADTNNSNLKNNYAKVKLWNYPKGRFVQTGMQFCGLIMGDHSKCGINTMFNTGTVIGVSANIYGAGFPRNFIPSFSWGGPGGTIEYKIDKAFETASVAMARRGIELDETEKKILRTVHKMTEAYRR